MTLEYAVAWVALAQGTIGLLVLLWRQAQMSLKVDLMWKLHEQDMLAAGREHDLFTRSSPYQINWTVTGRPPQEVLDHFRRLGKGKLPKDNVQLKTLLIRELGWCLISERATVFSEKLGKPVPPSLYLTWWVVALRQAERDGVNKLIAEMEHEGITLEDENV